MLDEAIAAYRRAIALDPGHANAYSNLGSLLRATGRVAEAEAAYRAAIRLNPDHIDAYTNLGILLAARTARRRRCGATARSRRSTPQHPAARRLLALAHCTLGEVDKAIGSLRGVARGGARQSDGPAHARRLLGRRRARAGVGRVRRRRRSTALRRASRPSWPSSTTARPRSSGIAGDRPGSGRRRRSTSSTPAAAPGCADRSSRRTRGG